jgi:hypothetical protein
LIPIEPVDCPRIGKIPEPVDCPRIGKIPEPVDYPRIGKIPLLKLCTNHIRITS